MGQRRRTKFCVWHCSATEHDTDIGADEIREWHTRAKPDGNGWQDIGYNAVIRLDGEIEFGRHFDEIGAHAFGYNAQSIGICLVGGLLGGLPYCTFSAFQNQAALALRHMVSLAYPGIRHVGHRDLSPDLDGDGIVERHEWMKDCPCFDVAHWILTDQMTFAAAERNASA